MDMTITPGTLTGPITPPPSKSQAHRLIIAAALAQGESVLSNAAFSQDITATLSCMEQLGAEWEDLGDGRLRIRGIPGIRFGQTPRLDCGESGSTLRFLIPIALAAAGGGVFTGRGRLMSRPQQPYFDIFQEQGIAYRQTGDTLTVTGSLRPGTFRLPGNVSSQFVTGLLYALPLLDGDSTLLLTSPLESRDYVAMTLDVLEKSGIRVEQEDFRQFRIPGGQRFLPGTAAIEADWSQAGFWYAAAFLDHPIQIQGMDPESVQGDRVISRLYWQLARPGETEIDVSGCPDLVPPLCVMAAVRSGVTHITNAARLRIKESDRLTAVTQTLCAMGAHIRELPEGLDITGIPALAGGVTVDACNDHRIAMMAAIAATRCQAPVTVRGAECVRKSYPNFWQDLEKLGGILEEQS